MDIKTLQSQFLGDILTPGSTKYETSRRTKAGATIPCGTACSTPLVGGQWKKGEKFKYDLHVVYNQPAPNIALDSPYEPIQCSRVSSASQLRMSIKWGIWHA